MQQLQTVASMKSTPVKTEVRYQKMQSDCISSLISDIAANEAMMRDLVSAVSALSGQELRLSLVRMRRGGEQLAMLRWRSLLKRPAELSSDDLLQKCQSMQEPYRSHYLSLVEQVTTLNELQMMVVQILTRLQSTNSNICQLLIGRSARGSALRRLLCG